MGLRDLMDAAEVLEGSPEEPGMHFLDALQKVSNEAIAGDAEKSPPADTPQAWKGEAPLVG